VVFTRAPTKFFCAAKNIGAIIFNGKSSSNKSFGEGDELGLASVRNCFQVIVTRPRFKPASTMLPASGTLTFANAVWEISFFNSSGQCSAKSQSEAKIVGCAGAGHGATGTGAAEIAGTIGAGKTTF